MAGERQNPDPGPRVDDLQSSAMYDISYSIGWFRAHRRSVGKLETHEAHQLHDQGKLYTVVASEADRTLALMEIRLEVACVGVMFLDEKRRVVLSWTFSALGLDGRQAPRGTCFLTSVVGRQFDDDTDKAAFGTSYDYGFDGTCQVIRENLRTRERAESQHHVDVSAHWEALPAFGCYEPFLRRERWTPIDVARSSDG
jgi:hypothetical protein